MDSALTWSKALNQLQLMKILRGSYSSRTSQRIRSIDILDIGRRLKDNKHLDSKCDVDLSVLRLYLPLVSVHHVMYKTYCFRRNYQKEEL